MKNYHQHKTSVSVSGGLQWAFMGTRPNWSEIMCCKVCSRSTYALFFFFLDTRYVLCLCFETLQFKFYLLNWLSCALQSSCFTVSNTGIVNENEPCLLDLISLPFTSILLFMLQCLKMNVMLLWITLLLSCISPWS